MSDTLGPYNVGFAITKSDTVNFDASVSTSGQNVKCCDAIYVGTAGTMAVVLQDGSVASMTCGVGLIPVRAIRVNSTNTAAAAMIAFYKV